VSSPANESGAGLAGRRALVTGGARGLGLAFAGALAAQGADVMIGDIDPDLVRSTADLVRRGSERGVRVLVDRLDISAPDDVARGVEHAATLLGGIDIVINNAAVVRVTRPLDDDLATALADFEAVVGVNLRGTYLVGRAAIPYLVERGGDIVNITTDHVHTCGYPIEVDHTEAQLCRWAHTRRPPLGGAGFDVYDASKAGVQALTRAWSRALAPAGVRVNSFGMGSTDTPMLRAHLGGQPLARGTMNADDVANVLVELILDGRTGDDVALWPGHPCRLGPLGLDGTLMASAQ